MVEGLFQGGDMQTRYVFATVFGVSETVMHRSSRLLKYEIGSDVRGRPVSVRTMLLQLGQDPEETARLLMLVEPLTAVGRLTRLVAGFMIDGEAAADPAAVARAALSYAGRVVTQAQAYPEINFLQRLLRRLRRPRP
jgi:hypothetical protein